MPECEWQTERGNGFLLLAQVEFFDHEFVTIGRRILEVIKKAAAFRDHLQKTAAGGVILDVRFEMLGEFVDSGGKQGDLHVGTAGVFVVHLEPLYFCCLYYSHIV